MGKFYSRIDEFFLRKMTKAFTMNVSAERRNVEQNAKYCEVAVLKERGYTRVVLAEHIHLKQKRIIKTVYRLSEETDAVLREALLMQQLEHPCIPVIYDIEEQENGFSIVEEYIPGESFTSYVQKNYLEINDILSFSLQLCELLEFLHKRERPILYLDLKPDNLIIHDKKLYLIDFGSAREQQEQRVEGALTGTPGFAPPECYRGSADCQSDLYSMGKMMEYMLSHSGKRRSEQRIYKKLFRICAKAASKKAADRYRSAEELKKAILSVQKRGKHKQSSRCLVVGMAGSSRRCGVTRFALWYLEYLQRQGIRALYLECNESDTVKRLLEQGNRDKLFSAALLKEARADMSAASGAGVYGLSWERQYYESQGCRILLADFGVLTADNRSMFLESDLPVLFSGGMPWEEENLWRALSMLPGKEGQFWLLFVFLGAKDFARWSRLLRDTACRRVPQIGEKTAGIAQQELQGLFEELTETVQGGEAE